MGDTFPNHNNNSEYRNPTFYYIGTLDPLGKVKPRFPRRRGQDSGSPRPLEAPGLRVQEGRKIEAWHHDIPCKVPLYIIYIYTLYIYIYMYCIYIYIIYIYNIYIYIYNIYIYIYIYHLYMLFRTSPPLCIPRSLNGVYFVQAFDAWVDGPPDVLAASL